MSKKSRKRAEALAAIIECVDFWEPILEQMALNPEYEHPWVPVEFARMIRKLAVVARDD